MDYNGLTFKILEKGLGNTKEFIYITARCLQTNIVCNIVVPSNVGNNREHIKKELFKEHQLNMYQMETVVEVGHIL